MPHMRVRRYNILVHWVPSMKGGYGSLGVGLRTPKFLSLPNDHQAVLVVPVDGF